jgi:hypothetical protein
MKLIVSSSGAVSHVGAPTLQQQQHDALLILDVAPDNDTEPLIILKNAIPHAMKERYRAGPALSKWLNDEAPDTERTAEFKPLDAASIECVLLVKPRDNIKAFPYVRAAGVGPSAEAAFSDAVSTLAQWFL